WLRARAEPSTGNTYAEWARLKNETYYEDGRKRLLTMFPENSRAIEPALSKHAKEFMWRVATNVHLQMNGLESLLHAVEKVSSKKRARPVQLIPYRFQFTNQLTKNHKLLLAFDALALSEATGCDVSLGKIMHGDGHATVGVKLTPLVRAVRKGITDIT